MFGKQWPARAAVQHCRHCINRPNLMLSMPWLSFQCWFSFVEFPSVNKKRKMEKKNGEKANKFHWEKMLIKRKLFPNCKHLTKLKWIEMKRRQKKTVIVNNRRWKICESCYFLCAKNSAFLCNRLNNHSTDCKIKIVV